MLAPVEQVVDRVVAVAARDDDGGRAERVDDLGELAPRSLAPRERPRLHQVRRHHRREREEPRDERLDGAVLQELRARTRDHHRIDDKRHATALEEVRDRLDRRTREEHARLRRVDADVGEHGLELLADETRRQLVHRRDGDSVLRRQRD